MDARVRNLIEELERFMGTVDDALAVPREAAAFVHGLLLASGGTRGVEIGTSYGYSALWAGAALKRNGGRLITIDHDERKCDTARAYVASAGLDDVVEVRCGVALDLLPLIEGPIDYVLNDADKQNCIRYVELLQGRLANRAVVLTDNTRTHPEALAAFMAWVRRDEAFFSTEVPVGNGMELSVHVGRGGAP